MHNLQSIVQNICVFEKDFNERYSQGNVLDSLTEFCQLFKPFWPPFFSLAITDTDNFIASIMGDDLKLPIKAGTKIEEFWKIKQAIASNETVNQLSNTFGFEFSQVIIPLHYSDGTVIGACALFYRPEFEDLSTNEAEYRNDLLQAISNGMETPVICRFIAERLNQLFLADLVLFTEFDTATESFLSMSEFKFCSKQTVFDNFDRVRLTNGHHFYKIIRETAQTCVSKPNDPIDIKSAPFKNDMRPVCIVTPIISRDQLIGSINVGLDNKLVSNQKTVKHIEEFAAYLSICLNRDRASNSFEQTVNKLSEAENKIHTLSRDRTLSQTTVDFIVNSRDQLVSLISNMLRLCDNWTQDSLEGLSQAVDLLQGIAARFVLLQKEDVNFNNAMQTVVDIKSIIDEVTLDIDEKIVAKSLLVGNVSLVNRITQCGYAELNREEFIRIFGDIMPPLIRRSHSGSLVYLDSIIDAERTMIKISNMDKNTPAQHPSQSIEHGIQIELLFRVMKMLINMCRVEFNFKIFSNSEFWIELIFKHTSSTAFIQPEKQINKPAQSLNRDLHVLIVDDDDSLRELMFDILESRQFVVKCFGEPMSALEEFKKRDYNLVITDLSLPKISGAELTLKIKEINPSIPVIMVTGWGSEIERIRNENPQIDFVLSKPFNLVELLDIVENSLQLVKT